MTESRDIANISYNDYLKNLDMLNKLKEDKELYIRQAESLMPNFDTMEDDDGSDDYTWEDERDMDEIFAIILPTIMEKIQELDKICKKYQLQFKKSIYQEYVKRKMRPENVNQYMIEKDINFLDISFDEILL